MAGKMITEGRLAGSMDQLQGTLSFRAAQQPAGSGMGDGRIQHACHALNRVVDLLREAEGVGAGR